MASYRLTPQARTGLRDLLDFVEREFGGSVAERVLGELEVAFELLAESPEVGHTREDLTTDDRIQFWSVGPTLIAYRLAAGIIEVLFAERGERDWERLLEKGV